jgi:hypothetical protein
MGPVGFEPFYKMGPVTFLVIIINIGNQDYDIIINNKNNLKF